MPLYCCVCVALCYSLMVQTTNTLKTWRITNQILNTYLATFTQNTRGDTVLDQTQPKASRTIAAQSVDEEESLPWWESGECDCVHDDCVPGPFSRKAFPPVTSSISVVGGTCGRRSWAAGDGQRVVSLALYDHNPEYWRGLNDIISQVGSVYPGWRVRLYTDPRGRGRVLCPLLRAHAHFDVCDVTSIPPPLGNLSKVWPPMWRLAPMGDAQVTVLLPRDTDSMIIQREVDAVREWLSSGKQFHIMRDHPKHDSLLLAGLWGVRWGPDLTGPAARNQDMGNTGFPAYHKDSDTVELAVQRLNSNPTRPAARKDNLSTTAFAARNQDSWSAGFTSGNHDLDYTQYHGYFLTVLRDDMMTLAKRKKAQNYGGDQRILDKIMWPVIKGHALTHDSYRCGQYEKDSIPWPTQRVDGLFVGCRRFKKNFENENIMEECPEKCRPPEHPDWLYC